MSEIGRNASGYPNRWQIVATVMAIAVAVFLGVVLSGGRVYAFAGVVAAIILATVAQFQFTETHRRVYNRWPAGWNFFWTGSPERRALVRAWTQRDPLRPVELARLFGIGLLAYSGLSALILLASASATP